MFKTGALRFFNSPPCASGTTVVFLPLVEDSLLVCTCLISGWHKLWAFMHFLDSEDDTTPHFREFSISREKQIVTDLLKYAKKFTCAEVKSQKILKSEKP
jgi:hypothetical protein